MNTLYYVLYGIYFKSEKVPNTLHCEPCCWEYIYGNREEIIYRETSVQQQKNSIVKYYPWQTRNVHDADNKTLLEELFPGK